MIVYREVSSLARDLGVDLKTLYALSNNLPAHYHAVSIPKPGGGTRRISVPDEALKRVQRAIARRILAYFPVSPYATAYRPGGGPVRNGAFHVGRREILKLDIRRFFDSVRYSAVKDAAFPPEVFSEPLRVLLTLLCYYNDALPQGAPTSPAVANLVLRDFDLQVGDWCRRRKIVYSRYCDDLIFSSDEGLAGTAEFVAARLRPMGLFLHEKKTVLLPAGRRQRVTGLVVNRRVNLPAEERRKLRQELYYCKKFGVADHLRKTGSPLTPEAYLDSLLGRMSWLLQADPENEAARRDRQWLLDQRRALHA